MRVWGAGCRVKGAGCMVYGAGRKVHGAGCRRYHLVASRVTILEATQGQMDGFCIELLRKINLEEVASVGD